MEDYTNIIDWLLENSDETKIARIFEMSIDMSNGDWDNEEEYGAIFDEHTKDIPKIGRHFIKEETA
jgi:hypothetical protein|tara:strand:- start:30 stop:227 length:198 start_codon:yes stop_codon:yes gene_type:complete